MNRIIILIALLILMGAGCSTNVGLQGKEEAAAQACINQGGIPLFLGSAGSMSDCKFK